MKRPVTRRQIAAGGIVYRRADPEPEVVLVRVQRGSEECWVLPKGLLAKGASPQEAAQREVREETGLLATVQSDFEPVDLWYVWPPGQRRVRIHKTIHHFLMRFVAGDTQLHDQEVEEARWFPLSEATALARYASDRRLLEQVESRLQAEFDSGGMSQDGRNPTPS